MALYYTAAFLKYGFTVYFRLYPRFLSFFSVFLFSQTESLTQIS